MKIEELDQAIKEVCPIDGVSIGIPEKPSTWSIQFRPEATMEQRQLALDILKSNVAIDITPPISALLNNDYILDLSNKLEMLQTKVDNL